MDGFIWGIIVFKLRYKRNNQLLLGNIKFLPYAYYRNTQYVCFLFRIYLDPEARSCIIKYYYALLLNEIESQEYRSYIPNLC